MVGKQNRRKTDEFWSERQGTWTGGGEGGRRDRRIRVDGCGGCGGGVLGEKERELGRE